MTAAITRFRLPNGLEVLYRRTPRNPISAAHLFLVTGAGSEPAHQRGLSALMWSLFLKGTRRRSARDMAEAMDRLGASLSAGANQDFSEISAHAIRDTFEPAMELLAEALFEPAFHEPELRKERDSMIAAIRSRRDHIFSVAAEAFYRRLFAGHPYAVSSSGTEVTVRRLRRDAVTAWHRRVVTPSGATLSIATPMPLSQVRTMVTRLFGAWRGPRPLTAPRDVRRGRPFKVAIPSHFDQAYLLEGFAAPGAAHPDYLPLKIAVAALGGGMSSRLFQSLREREALAYDVGAFYATRRHGSCIVVHLGLERSRLGAARQRAGEELTRFVQEGLSPEELADTKRYLLGSFLLEHQTNSQKSHYPPWWRLMGLPQDFDDTYARRLQAVTSTQVRAAVRRWMGGARSSVTLLGRHRRP